MLFGGYQHNIDKKGRVFIPAKLREELGSGFMICRGIYGKRCLCGYSAEEWDKLEQKINQLPMSRGRSVKRYFFSNAVTVEPDKQGRILLPPHLREYAHLEKDVIVTGASDHAEIWDVERWQSYIGHLTSESVAEELDSLEF